MVLEKGQSIRDLYKGQSLDEIARSRAPLLEFYPARYRLVVNAVLQESTSLDVDRFSASFTRVVKSLQVLN
jgi:hypothetical protein